MKKLRKNNSARSIKEYNLSLSADDDLLYYLSHKNSSKATEIKLKQSRIKGYLDLSNIGLDSIPEEIVKPNYSIDGIKWWLNVDFTKIDLSYNNLSEKNFYNFRNLPYVKILNLAWNRFNIIPVCIFYLKNLIVLNMSNNRITYIDNNFFWNLSNLRSLNLSGNKIKYIPTTIKYMANLEELNMSKNDIMSIPNELIYLKYLKILKIGWNKIHLIAHNLFNNLLSLEELYCNNNSLTNIENINTYSVFDSIINLRILDISSNQFQDFLSFHQLPNLEKINISNNKLQNVFGLNLCEKLYEIDCSNNLFKEVPTDFLSINTLEILNLNGNELNDLPTSLSLLDHLSELYIDGNPMKLAPNLKYSNTAKIKQYLRYRLSKTGIYHIPQNLKKYYIKRVDKKYNTIDGGYPYFPISRHSPIYKFIRNNTQFVITNSDLREIPFDLLKYNVPENFLTVINLSDNLIERGLENFSNIIYLLTNVKIINFSRNNIRYFPIVLLYLPLLEELYLSGNLLSIFPAKNMIHNNTSNVTQSLLVLDLSDNLLEEFPVIIGFFKRLKILNLSFNKIGSLENLIHMRLENLERFLLDNNQIYKIPKNVLFRSIPNVVTFTISNNYLTDIPTDLFLLSFLEHINFDGNYISKIPVRYLFDASDLKNYLKNFHIFSEEQSYFEADRGEKIRNNYSYSFEDRERERERERLNKTVPIYNRRKSKYRLHYNYGNNSDILWSSTNYNPYLYKISRNVLNNEYKINKYISELYDNSEFDRNLADINSEIYGIQYILKDKKIQPYEKANLRKKFLGLIQERADLYK